MKLQLGENLKKLRRGRDITQEELANALGTTPQSVSNWERGDCYPDMELVPRVAGYFDVTLDELFGMPNLRVEERIAELVQRENGEILANDLDAWKKSLDSWRELAREYPNNNTVLAHLARALVGFGMTAEEYEANGREAAEMLERVLERCTDGALRRVLEARLVRAYAQAGETVKALEHARRLPLASEGRECAFDYLVVFDKRFREHESVEKTAETLNEATYWLSLLLYGHLATIDGAMGSSGGLPPIDYGLSEEYRELKDRLLELSMAYEKARSLE
jgi:transcriptional regulator with XRE-family HTH domain